MERYKFIKKKTFEKLEDFENRVNETASAGWRVVNFGSDGGAVTVLFEKIKP